MVDILKRLPPFTWRGELYPITSRRVTLRQGGVDHVIQYRDFESIEPTGAQGLTFVYGIPQRENIARDKYKNAFSVGHPRLFRDMVDRSAGTLFDPIFNKAFQCVPSLYDDTTDVLKRDGTDVQVEFRYSPPITAEDPALTDLGGVSGLQSSAKSLDAEVAKANWAQEPPPEPSIDVIQGVDGLMNQGLAQVGKARAALADFAFKMQKLEATCEKVADPANWAIHQDARTQRASAIRMSQRLNEDPATKLRTLVVQTTMPIGDLAREVGMSLEDLVALNPSLARLPYVKAGTVVIVRAAPSQAA